MLTNFKDRRNQIKYSILKDCFERIYFGNSSYEIRLVNPSESGDKFGNRRPPTGPTIIKKLMVDNECLAVLQRTAYGYGLKQIDFKKKFPPFLLSRNRIEHSGQVGFMKVFLRNLFNDNTINNVTYYAHYVAIFQ